MAMFETKSEKKSLIITAIVNVALILVLLFFGLSYMDPPEESGIAINFGDSEIGMGNESPPQVEETTQAQETSTEEETESSSEEEVTEQEEESTTEEQSEEAITQEIEEAPVVNKEENKRNTEKKEKKAKENSKEKQDPEKNTEKEKVEKEPDPQPEKSTSDALKSILSGSSEKGDETKGEGDDNKVGVKGDPDGDPDQNSYYGQGEGLDGDGNYRLGGRKALTKKKYVQDCNESGTVVVRIRVNRQGQVVNAEAGIKGTTNTSSCLLEPAKRAALDTKFNSDANAPSTQTGLIIYEFKLTD